MDFTPTHESSTLADETGTVLSAAECLTGIQRLCTPTAQTIPTTASEQPTSPAVTPDSAQFGTPKDSKKMFQCKHCNKVFTTSSNRSRHQRLVHRRPPMSHSILGAGSRKVSLTCMQCGTTLRSSTAFDIHRQQCSSNRSLGLSDLGEAGGESYGDSWKEAKYEEDEEVICMQESITTPSSSSSSSSSSSTISSSSPTTSEENHLSPSDKEALLEFPIDRASIVVDSDPEESELESQSEYEPSSLEDDSDTQEDEHDSVTQEGDSGVRHTEPHRKRVSQHAAELSKLTSCPALIDETVVNKVCGKFIEWLKCPPVSPAEVLAKQRRLTSPVQERAVSNNLRFILTIVVNGGYPVEKVTLTAFSHIDICQTIHDALKKRKVGPARYHAIFLLLKKVLVYLSSMKSMRKRAYIMPQVLPSWSFVDSVVADKGATRKLISANRMLFGNCNPALMGREAPTSALAATLTPGPNIPGNGLGAERRSDYSSQQVLGALPSSSTGISVFRQPPLQPRPATASKDDLTIIAKRCIEFLTGAMQAEQRTVVQQHLSDHMTAARARALLYGKYLVTAMLVTMPSPRSQVLKLMKIGETLIADQQKHRWWVRIPAELSKIRKPVLQAINDQLTDKLEFYLERMRPLLLDAQQPDHKFAFVNNRGQRANDLTSWTKQVTQAIVGRPMTCHSFRSAMVTMFHDHAETSEKDMVDLAEIMNHDFRTSRSFYYQGQREDKALKFNQRLSLMLQS